MKTAFLLCLSTLACFRCILAQTGAPDSTFNGAGFVTTSLLPYGNTVNCLAVQPDGKILAAGVASGGSINFDPNDFAITRYLPDGSLDTTFNGDGKATFDILNHNQDNARAVLLQDDQRIILAGYTYFYVPKGSNSVISVVRLNPDGAMDESFADNGKLVLSFQPNIYCYAAALQPDHKIVLAGQIIDNFFHHKVLVVRINPDGSLDQGFNNSGWTEITFLGINNPEAESVSIQTDGKIVLTGYDEIQQGKYVVARLLSDGQLDNSFSSDGKLLLNHYNQGYAQALTVQPDGRIFVLGNGVNPVSNLYENAIIGLKANGAIDFDYGVNSKAIVTVPGTNLFGSALVSQADGKLLAAGTAVGQADSFYIARVTQNGDRDSTFGVNGVAMFGFGEHARCNAVTLTKNQQILLGGVVGTDPNSQFAVVKLRNDLTSAVKDPRFKPTGFIYPNPTQGRSILDFSMPADGFLTLELTDLTGRILFRFLDKASLNEGRHEIPLELPIGMSSGCYLLTLKTDSGYSSLKFFVSR